MPYWACHRVRQVSVFSVHQQICLRGTGSRPEFRIRRCGYCRSSQGLEYRRRGSYDVLVHHSEVEEHGRCHGRKYARLDTAAKPVGHDAYHTPLFLELVRYKGIAADHIVSLVLLEAVHLYESSVYPHCLMTLFHCVLVLGFGFLLLAVSLHD